ncbi:beta-ketoacyl-ACP synthase III [Alkalibacter saccharofermentans]|uniref:Beta-ketoacyl-[acyl-carrier-protein] synthase III n=1 Tax=Alkalibacter saccharofermentans DSM 14828 TaxID=1120975 RepID=A0A1M4VWS2_9FIRM|nr:beta-ketoacyl-ACP synthase III [Alkalibacter saccharofermentans]SHE73484.1 3-oxoacyl-[acyl-carrier-protein] synthase-3 [Alkalibacter saccharofermentans DSM 14828]
MKTSKIIAVGKALAQKTVTNDDLSALVDTNDQWIKSRTGIEQRRISVDESTTDLAYRASLDAMKNGNIDPNTIDMIIVATISPDSFMPSTASMLQYKLGINDRHVMAFDLNAACTGLIYGIQTAHKFIQTKTVKRALVVGAETLSRTLNWEDRSTCVLFGDGAGAVVLETSDTGIISDYTNSRGDVDMNLALPALPLRSPFTGENTCLPSWMSMNGAEIFKFATFAVKDSVDYVLNQADLDISDIKYIVPHQANERIIGKVAKVMGLPKDKFFINLMEHGNTSSASIGIALAEMMEKGLVAAGDKVILTGFGGGLTWGAILHEF